MAEEKTAPKPDHAEVVAKMKDFLEAHPGDPEIVKDAFNYAERKANSGEYQESLDMLRVCNDGSRNKPEFQVLTTEYVGYIEAAKNFELAVETGDQVLLSKAAIGIMDAPSALKATVFKKVESLTAKSPDEKITKTINQLKENDHPERTLDKKIDILNQFDEALDKFIGDPDITKTARDAAERAFNEGDADFAEAICITTMRGIGDSIHGTYLQKLSDGIRDLKYFKLAIPYAADNVESWKPINKKWYHVVSHQMESVKERANELLKKYTNIYEITEDIPKIERLNILLGKG